MICKICGVNGTDDSNVSTLFSQTLSANSFSWVPTRFKYGNDNVEDGFKERVKYI